MFIGLDNYLICILLVWVVLFILIAVGVAIEDKNKRRDYKSKLWYKGFLEAESYLKEYGYKRLVANVKEMRGFIGEYQNGFRDYLDHYENNLPRMIMVEGVYVPRDIELSTKNFHTKSNAAEKNARRKLKSFREENVL